MVFKELIRNTKWDHKVKFKKGIGKKKYVINAYKFKNYRFEKYESNRWKITDDIAKLLK